MCFNPATVWFELSMSISTSLTYFSFNPATVWFEQSTPARSVGWMVFQSRNGLIWTEINDCDIICHLSFNPATVWFEPSSHRTLSSSPATFQSRNGLIWTLNPPVFNTLYSRFQSRNGLIWTCIQSVLSLSSSVSIPQRSDLNHEVNLTFEEIIFSFNPATVWFERDPHRKEWEAVHQFQSRNGLIWTPEPAS